ncbi:molybdopterin synthase catalytic subunit MoaE [Aliiglaciecola sp.]|nr:molybdopterin synthase catalytic subunit MoaE [Aliiglaciecola sp.]
MSNAIGSSPQIRVSVQFEDFNLGDEYQEIKNRDQGQGAVVTFSGLVRDNNLGKNVKGLFLEHYPAMTQKCLIDICEQACKRWELAAVSVIHRVGELSLNEQIVFVGVSAKHRKSAFEGCEFIMDYLKTQAPFWKKERFADGEAWVDAKQSDQHAANKW